MPRLRAVQGDRKVESLLRGLFTKRVVFRGFKRPSMAYEDRNEGSERAASEPNVALATPT
jgi:hypothetical protein